MSENERKTEPEETAVLIIDMQRDFVEPGAPLEVKGAADTVPVIARFLEFARKKGGG